MRITTIHINALIVCLILAGLQAFIVWRINGDLDQLLLNGSDKVPELALIFSPAAAIAWIGKHFAKQAGD